jgi:hypothetical protein
LISKRLLLKELTKAKETKNSPTDGEVKPQTRKIGSTTMMTEAIGYRVKFIKA